MKYLDVYYNYLKQIDKKRNDLGDYLLAKEETNSFEIIHTEEINRKIYYAILISDILLMIFAGVFYSFIKEYFNVDLILYYILFAILLNFGLIVAIFVFKYKIKLLKDKSNTKEAIRLKEEYRIESEKIYNICPLIIILNDYYYELSSLNKEDQVIFYKNKHNEIQKDIGFIYKTQNIDAYKEYFEKWLSKKQE